MRRTMMSQAEEKLMEMDVAKIPSEVLKRLVEEVRQDEAEDRSRYSRFHNRHNRSGRPRPWPGNADES
jgi:hypothetical protein